MQQNLKTTTALVQPVPQPVRVEDITPRNASAQVRVVTPEEARELRLTAHYQHQRDMQRAHVRDLANAMHGGLFVGVCSNVAIVNGLDHNGDVVASVVVNGNHTLEAICASGLAQTVIFTTVAVPVEDLDAYASMLYTGYDRGAKRGRAAIDRASGIEDALKEIPPSQMGIFGKAAEMICFGIPANLRDVPPEARELVKVQAVNNRIRKDYAKAMAAITKILDEQDPGSRKLVIKSAEVLAVLLLIFEAELRNREEFLRQYLTGEKDGGEPLPAESPAAQLRQFMTKDLERPHGEAKREDRARNAAQAWSSFFEGQPHAGWSKRRPLTIAGTDWVDGTPGHRPIDAIRESRDRVRVSKVTLTSDAPKPGK